ncbi:hypothetical protein VitviT2T_010060 [Vitis vinifera]|uniref:VWA-Hint protein Vwaint domain-containing protein n=1 Tax=Vitis vinifera TaxID=29760 RepID=A0ABY9C6N9_VITVI|nr:hypothetical protein VitviT2T_010060 [Vitis vinifera]
MVWRSVYMSLIFSPPSLCVSWPTLVLVRFLKVEVRIAVERGDLSSAVVVLESCRRALLETISVRAGDGLCVALGVELKEMQERMANMRIYETSGRAYMLSGLSSHSWQRSIAIEPMNYSKDLVPENVDQMKAGKADEICPSNHANQMEEQRIEPKKKNHATATKNRVVVDTASNESGGSKGNFEAFSEESVGTSFVLFVLIAIGFIFGSGAKATQSGLPRIRTHGGDKALTPYCCPPGTIWAAASGEH